MPAVLVDHTDSWREARLTQTLAQAYENALPPRLFSVVVDHAQRVAQLEREGDAYTFGKRTTFWLPLRDTPLSPIEAAIQSGGLNVSARAIAMQRGGPGEIIRLKISTTGRIIQGRILSAKQAEVIQ